MLIHFVRALLAVAVVAAASPLRAQDEPRFAQYAAVRVVVLPAQDVAGPAVDAREWLARFDSLLTARFVAAGVADAWAYPRDLAQLARRNPTYAPNPYTLGAQPLNNDRVREGAALPEPFASRSRALLALADARYAVVPVVARIDTAASPRQAEMRLLFVDGRQSRVMWSGMLQTAYEGEPAAAADSLARRVSALFIRP